MNFKKLESGRSMVEMLGVLAIIGVLSVGGIAGYSLSMRRHRANGVADMVSKYALVTYNQCQQKVMNGELNGIDGCYYSNMMSFEDAGIGAFPSGVSDMFILGMQTDAQTGIDKVTVGVGFNDEKLCQAAGSISGLGCSGGSSVNFEIKQN